MSIRNAVAALAACAALASTAHAQLRIVSINASNSGSAALGRELQASCWNKLRALRCRLKARGSRPRPIC